VNPVIIASHSVTKTGCRSLLHHLNRVYISAVQSSYQTLLGVLGFYAFVEAERDTVTERLKEGKVPPYTFVLVDVDRRSLEFVSFGDEAREEEESDKRRELEHKRERTAEIVKRAEAVFESLWDAERTKSRARIVTDLLVGRLLESVDPSDFSLRFVSADGEVRVNLVDYVCCLQDPAMEEMIGDDRAGELRQFHEHLDATGSVMVPSVLIKNRHFLGVVEGDAAAAADDRRGRKRKRE
jgi:hypothetical protein